MSIWHKLFGGSKSDDPATLQAQAAAAKDRVVRVFVSSTFKDMIADRNELMAHVWPSLRKICRSRHVEFVEVDLRWGVTEEQSQRKETLRHCLAEIKRCRPFFIGLLGERYGWTPGPEAYPQALLDEEDWLKNGIAKHSVTELEILHGVLRDPEMAGRSFFYFRDPAYDGAKGGDCLPEDAVKKALQADLKARVKKVCAAQHIPLRENYADPAALAALVLKDLSGAIDAEFAADQTPDVWSREDRDHEAYARSRRADFYVGRDAYFSRLNDIARDGAEGCGLTILGESGGGKSALLANWTNAWRKSHPNDFVFQHFIGSSAMSAGHLALMRRLMVAIIRWEQADKTSAPRGLEEEENKIPAKADEIVKAFPEYLSRLAYRAKQKGVRAIIVLDALNQIEDRERGRLLGWLPHRLPGEVSLLVSTLKGDTLDALQPRAWPAMTVEPLQPEERVQLIARYLDHFSQSLSDVRARKIAGVAAASNPLYLKTLLDDLRVTGDHLMLDEQITDYLKAADLPALFTKILARYEGAHERDHNGLVGEALSLLWAARRGLTEPELLQALRPAGKDRLPAAVWSPLRCALEDGLVDRDGVLAFAHEHLRMAVERRYVATTDKARTLRMRLADDFARRPVDAREADELPWLLWQADARDRLRACLLDIDRFLLMRDRDENELFSYWVYLKQERNLGWPYVQGFERWAAAGRETTGISAAASRLAVFLAFHAALFEEAEALMRRALAIDEECGGESAPVVARDLGNLASLLRNTNRLVDAESMMRQALRIIENSFGKECPDAATMLNNLAVVLEESNRRPDAEPLMRRAMAIFERCYGSNHPNVATCCGNLARLLTAEHRHAESEPLMRRALAIDEQYFGPHHPNVAISLNNLATFLHANGRLVEAESMFSRALSINLHSKGECHPEVATTLNNLAMLLQSTNRLEEAEQLMLRALRIDESVYGASHPEVARDLNNLSLLSYLTGRFADAESLSLRNLEILMQATQSTRRSHPNLNAALYNVVRVMKALNRSEQEVRSTIEELGVRYGIDLGQPQR